MRNLATIFLISLLITSCSSSNSTTEPSNLNGKWATACDTTSPVNAIANSESNQRVMSFNDGLITNQLYLYSDTACSNIISKDDDNLFAGLLVSYTVGNTTTSSNGASVKEIDFVNSDGDALPDIYLLLNANTTLYLGIKEQSLKVQCPSNSGQSLPSIPTCWDIRPTEINYNEEFTKLIE